MRALSTLLVLLSLTNFGSGAKIRVESSVEEETPKAQLKQDPSEGDEHFNASAGITEDHSVILKAIAKQHNLTIDEAKEVGELQHDFEKLVDDLFDDSNFLQSEIPTELNGPFILKFKNGKVPEKGLDRINNFMAKNKNAKLEIVHSRLSLKEAEERGDRLLDKLKSKGHPQGGYAINGDNLQVWAIKPDQKAQRSLRELKREDIGKISLSRTAEIFDLDHDDRDLEGLELHLREHNGKDMFNHQGNDDAELTHNDEDMMTHERTGARELRRTRIIGGLALATEKGENSCTSGFVVQHKETKRCGIVTAGHCGPAGPYNLKLTKMRTSTKEYSVTIPIFEKEISISKKGEYTWYSFSPLHIPTNEVYEESGGSSRPVTEIAQSQSEGQMICLYSRKRGKTLCGLVWSSRAKLYVIGIDQHVKKVVMMRFFDDEEYDLPGDSGGPWFGGYNPTKAHGIHGGSVFIEKGDNIDACNDNNRCAYFSKMAYIEDKLDLELVTSDDIECRMH